MTTLRTVWLTILATLSIALCPVVYYLVQANAATVAFTDSTAGEVYKLTLDIRLLFFLCLFIALIYTAATLSRLSTALWITVLAVPFLSLALLFYSIGSRSEYLRRTIVIVGGNALPSR